MGDIADMMLYGILCQQCGEFVGEECGYPKNCVSCGAEEIYTRKLLQKSENIARNARQKKTKCPDCGKKVKEVGMSNHIRDAHGGVGK